MVEAHGTGRSGRSHGPGNGIEGAQGSDNQVVGLHLRHGGPREVQGLVPRRQPSRSSPSSSASGLWPSLNCSTVHAVIRAGAGTCTDPDPALLPPQRVSPVTVRQRCERQGLRALMRPGLLREPHLQEHAWLRPPVGRRLGQVVVCLHGSRLSAACPGRRGRRPGCSPHQKLLVLPPSFGGLSGSPGSPRPPAAWRMSASLNRLGGGSTMCAVSAVSSCTCTFSPLGTATSSASPMAPAGSSRSLARKS